MILYEFVSIDGEEYPINTSFRIAIECDSIINDVQIDDLDRGVLITGLLFGEDSPYNEEALSKAAKYLGGDEEDGKHPRLIDFNQHWDLIYSTFKGQYGIDLHTVDMHYQEFCMLLKGANDTALTKVVELLTYDLSQVKEVSQKRKIIEAQNRFKIKESNNETRRESVFFSSLDESVKGGRHG